MSFASDGFTSIVIVAKYISNADSSEKYSYMAEKSDYLEECIWDEIQDSIYNKINDKLISINSALDIKIDDFDIIEMKYDFDISGAINASLKEDQEYDEDKRYNSGVSDLVVIKSMFER